MTSFDQWALGGNGKCHFQSKASKSWDKFPCPPLFLGQSGSSTGGWKHHKMKTTEERCHFHYMMSNYQHDLSVDNDLDRLTEEMFIRLLHCEVTLLPFHIL